MWPDKNYVNAWKKGPPQWTVFFSATITKFLKYFTLIRVNGPKKIVEFALKSCQRKNTGFNLGIIEQ